MRSRQQSRTMGHAVALVCGAATAVALVRAPGVGARRGLQAGDGRETIHLQLTASALLRLGEKVAWPGPTVDAPRSTTESSGDAHGNTGGETKALAVSLTLVRRHIRKVTCSLSALVWRIHARLAKTGYQGRHRPKRRYP